MSERHRNVLDIEGQCCGYHWLCDTAKCMRLQETAMLTGAIDSFMPICVPYSRPTNLSFAQSPACLPLPVRCPGKSMAIPAFNTVCRREGLPDSRTQQPPRWTQSCSSLDGLQCLNSTSAVTPGLAVSELFLAWSAIVVITNSVFVLDARSSRSYQDSPSSQVYAINRLPGEVDGLDSPT